MQNVSHELHATQTETNLRCFFVFHFHFRVPVPQRRSVAAPWAQMATVRARSGIPQIIGRPTSRCLGIRSGNCEEEGVGGHLVVGGALFQSTTKNQRTPVNRCKQTNMAEARRSVVSLKVAGGSCGVTDLDNKAPLK